MQTKNSWFRGAVTCVFLFGSLGASADYRDHPNAAALIERVAAKGVDRDWLDGALSEATKQQSILKRFLALLRRVSPGPNIRIFFSLSAELRKASNFGARIVMR